MTEQKKDQVLPPQEQKSVAHFFKKYLSLFIFLAIILMAASLSSLPTFGSKEQWYLALNLPGYTPPNWLFSIVWPLLYVLMAVSAWLVWKVRHQQPVTKAMAVFAFQLLVNLTWAEIFFGMQNTLLGFIWIVILWFCIGLTVYLFWKIRRLAALLLLPYWLWVSFAVVLAGHIWLLNF